MTREGMKVAKAKGWLRGKQPKWKPNQAKHLVELHDLGTYTQAEFASSSVSDGQRSTELWSACDLLRRNPSDHSCTLQTEIDDSPPTPSLQSDESLRALSSARRTRRCR